VAAQLALLRPVADELVVAVDTSVDAELTHPLAELADVLVRYPYAEPVDRPVGWVHSLCTRDWILWVDDDEIPSASLVAAVRGVIGDPGLTHCYVPRRTLWQDGGHALAGPPWVPDFQLRLVRNDRALVWFPGITHWPIQAIGPHRYLEEPLYHTDLLLTPLERREAKVRRYEAALPGRRVAGLPMNDAYFLPEHRDSIRLEPIDAADRDVVSGILELEPWPTRAPPERSLRTATREEIDTRWHGAPAVDGLYRGSLELPHAVEAFVVGEERPVVVRVANAGTHVWPHGEVGWPSIHVSYRWLDETGGVSVGEGLRTALPATLPPGASLLASVDVASPPQPGRHTLVLDLVHEHVRWFGCAVETTVDVRPSPCVAILGENERAALDAAATLAEIAPAVRPLVLASSPGELSERHGYGCAPEARAYVLGARPSRNRALALGGALARASALVAAAGLRRLGATPRLAAPGGASFLDGLAGADALLVVGNGTLGGARGEREALQQRAAILAARGLGLTVVVLPDAGVGLRTALGEAVERLGKHRA
jgi:hypothetical protein